MFVAMKLNLSKFAFLTKRCWTEAQVEIQLKYLGILLGHVTSEEAYAPTIAKATQRAHFLSHFDLTHDERVAVFQEWVLPLFIFPARANFPTDPVVTKIVFIYKVAPSLNN